MWRLGATLARLQHRDERVCVSINRGARQRPVVLALQAVSWLGNGIFWYALMLALLIADPSGAALPVLHMAFAGAVCTCCYKMVKHSTGASAVQQTPWSRGREVLIALASSGRRPRGRVTVIACALSGLWVILVPFTVVAVCASRSGCTTRTTPRRRGPGALIAAGPFAVAEPRHLLDGGDRFQLGGHRSQPRVASRRAFAELARVRQVARRPAMMRSERSQVPHGASMPLRRGRWRRGGGVVEGTRRPLAIASSVTLP
jgi:undecaprenyl-diphosphatase